MLSAVALGYLRICHGMSVDLSTDGMQRLPGIKLQTFHSNRALGTHAGYGSRTRPQNNFTGSVGMGVLDMVIYDVCSKRRLRNSQSSYQN